MGVGSRVEGCGLSVSPLANPNCKNFGVLDFSFVDQVFHFRSHSQSKSRAELSQSQSQSESQSQGRTKKGKQIENIAMQSTATNANGMRDLGTSAC